MTFENLGIIDPILKALRAEGYTRPTPIQEQSIPILLNRKDLLGCAQTGTGKTAAFAIPLIQHLHQSASTGKGRREIKALVVTPTRELALQIGESFSTYGKFTDIRNIVIFGGVKQSSQTLALQRGTDVLVATPGRLLDLINQKYITLRHIEYFVLDEADHMLDMGFIHDIRKIIELLPKQRQSLFFSATMPATIVELSQKILGTPQKVTIQPEQTTAERVDQLLYYVDKKDKPQLLNHLLQTKTANSVLVFARTKHGADKIARSLAKSGIGADAIHGNKSQNARQRALDHFKQGKLRVLVATDIAARGIDVEELELVINYDLPNIPETYVHRIGRTGRANASGQALSFCDSEERAYLYGIQKLIGQKIPLVEDHLFPPEADTDSASGTSKLPESKSPEQKRNNPRPFKQSNSGPRSGWNRNKQRSDKKRLQ